MAKELTSLEIQIGAERQRVKHYRYRVEQAARRKRCDRVAENALDAHLMRLDALLEEQAREQAYA
jgi:hypothetical protein